MTIKIQKEHNIAFLYQKPMSLSMCKVTSPSVPIKITSEKKI